MNDKDTSRSFVKVWLLSGQRRIWQGTPRHFRPALGVLCYSAILVLLHGVAALSSRRLGDSRVFPLNWETFGLIVVAALISALIFGTVRAKLPDDRLSPWILGQVVSWGFWGSFCAMSTLGLVQIRRDSSLLEFLLPIVGFGFVVGIILFSIKRRQDAA